MLQLNNLEKITKKRKRVGRGGDRGGTSCRGSKGQKSRSGSNSEIKASFEGGQKPLALRIPRRGFNNKPFQVEVKLVNLHDLETKFNAGDTVNVEALKAKGLVKGNRKFEVKVLGEGELTKKLVVNAHAFSKSAVEAIEKAGGKAVKAGENESGGTAA